VSHGSRKFEGKAESIEVRLVKIDVSLASASRYLRMSVYRSKLQRTTSMSVSYSSDLRVMIPSSK
jgi:hypothetical protein